MKAEELNSYRDNDGYIDYSKFEEEKGNGCLHQGECGRTGTLQSNE